MHQDSDDDTGWSESKSFYVNFDISSSLWSLTISTKTKQKEEGEVISEEFNEEILGPFEIDRFRKILESYDLKLDDSIANEIIKRSGNKHLL
jgi:hypothetical protein